MKTGKALFTFLLLTLFMIATSAMAAPIKTWNYEMNYKFIGWTSDATGSNVTDPDFKDSNITATLDNTKLSWGNPLWPNKTQSSISVSGISDTNDHFGYSKGIYKYEDGPTTIMTFAHANLPIANPGIPFIGRPALKRATLNSSITLIAGETPQDQDFFIRFWETPNNAGWGFGDVDDIFYLINSQDLDNTFQIDDYLYTLTFCIEGLDELQLTQTEKDNLGIENGADGEYYGLRTAERGTSDFKVKFSITPDDSPSHTPEPATMILFGMGMIGMAGIMRRKKAV